MQEGPATCRNEIVHSDPKPSVGIRKSNLRLEEECRNTLFSVAIEERENEKEERAPSDSWICFSVSNRVIFFLEKKPILFVNMTR